MSANPPIQSYADLVTSPITGKDRSSIIRFEDATVAPSLRYDIPLPSSFHGRYFIHLDFSSLKWTEKAKKNRRNRPRGVFSVMNSSQAIQNALQNNPVVLTSQLTAGNYIIQNPNPTTSVSTQNGNIVSISQTTVQNNLNNNKHPILTTSWGGKPRVIFVDVPRNQTQVKPKIIVIEHYKLTTFFGNYGAGKTTKTFSLFPGEETTLYVRSWRRTEQRIKQASSIFDSWTTEAADDFEQSLLSETSTKEASEESDSWEAKASGGLNLGFASFGGSAGGGGSSHSSRESLSKNVGQTSVHHASKKSAARETEVSTEKERTEAAEFENIIERKVKNTNFSRVLNITTRELNQEVITFFSLFDVTVAVVNNAGLFDFAPIHAIDSLLEKYVEDQWDGSPPNDAANRNPHQYITDKIIAHASTVFDYKGESKNFIEQAPQNMGNYWRVKRRKSPDDANPHYPVPTTPPPGVSEINIGHLLSKVDGVVTNITKNVIKTDGLIVDALLGQGIALDKYALGTQQEVLRSKQIENLHKEKALQIIEAAPSNDEKAELYKEFFVCCPDQIIQNQKPKHRPN